MRSADVVVGVAACALVSTAFASCILDTQGQRNDETATTTTSAATAGGASAAGGSAGSPSVTVGGMGGTPGQGGGTAGGAGGTGGVGGAPTDPLSETPAVVRYFLDEATSGMTPTMALDAAAAPEHLTLDYGAANLSYATFSPTATGLRWGAAADAGIAWLTPLAGTKVKTAIDGTSQATLEVVLAVDDAATDAQIAGITANSCSTYCDNLVLMTDGDGDLRLFMNDQLVGAWDPDWTTRGRVVAHVVVDSTLAAAAQRARLYLDGAAVPSTTAAIVPQNSGVGVGDDAYLLIGNRLPHDQSLEGWIGYFALYDTALTPATIAQHSERLSASDDTDL